MPKKRYSTTGGDNPDAIPGLVTMFGESHLQRAEIEALLEGSRAILQYRPFDKAARNIYDACKHIIGATAGYIALLSKDGSQNELLFLDTGGQPCEVDQTLPMPIRGLRAEAHRTGKTVYNNNFSETAFARFLPPGHVPLNNVLFAPLIIDGKVVGLLGLAEKPGGFGEKDLEIATAFSNLAAIALQNSRLLESLKTSEERQRSIVRTAVDAIVSTDSHGNIVLWNRGAETIFGYSAEEAIGKPLTMLMPERLRKAHKRGINRVVSTGEKRLIGKTIELTGLRKNGCEFPIELSLATWKEKDETFFTAIIRDITKRKEMEEALNETTRQLIEAQRISGVGSWEWNIITGKIHSSDEIYRIYGVDSQAFPTIDSFLPLVHPDDRQKAIQVISEVVREGKPANLEERLILPDGSVRFVHLRGEVVAFDESGNPLKMVGTVQDITERKKAEQLKDEFIGMVSHELKTPLTVIMGVLNTLTLKGVTEKQTQELLQDAISGADNLASIVENLLELSRSQANRLELHPETVDIGQIARTVTRKLQSKSEIHRLTVDVPAGLPVIQVDPIRVERILYNLMENAMKYSPLGGEIRVFIRQQDDNLIVGVSDQGPGISPDDQRRLFQSFEQLEVISRRAMQGVGLGLKVCQTLVDMHGGRIWVESEVGKGSTFFFTLPFKT